MPNKVAVLITGALIARALEYLLVAVVAGAALHDIPELGVVVAVVTRVPHVFTDPEVADRLCAAFVGGGALLLVAESGVAVAD